MYTNKLNPSATLEPITHFKERLEMKVNHMSSFRKSKKVLPERITYWKHENRKPKDKTEI